VLDGSMQTKSFQIGADVGQTISVNLGTSVKSSDMGKIATSSTGDISGLFKTSAATAGSVEGTIADPTTGTTAFTVGSTSVSFTGAAGKTVDDVVAATNTAIAAGTDAGKYVATNDNGKLLITTVATGAAATIAAPTGTTGVTFGTPVAGADAKTGSVTLGAGDLNIDGKDITGTFSTAQDLSDAINAAGISGVSSAVSGDGKSLNLYANSALTVYGAAADSASTATNALKFAGAAATSGAATAIAASGSLQGGDVKTVDDANALISRVDVALKSVSDFAAQLGAVQNRFQSTISTVAAQTTNLQASQSTIQDADFASETANLSKAQVLQQAGISVLAQANSNPQQVLKLLQ